MPPSETDTDGKEPNHHCKMRISPYLTLTIFIAEKLTPDHYIRGSVPSVSICEAGDAALSVALRVVDGHALHGIRQALVSSSLLFLLPSLMLLLCLL